MDAEEWFSEYGYEGVKSEITPILQTVEGYPEFYKHKIMAAFKAGNIQVKDECYKKLKEKDVIIEFLKKELIHKTCYRQAMKRQYRDLKQQKKCNCTICRFERKEISVLKYAQELGELLFAAVKDKCLADVKEGKMQPSTAKRVIDYLEKPYADIKDEKYSILSCHFLRENPKDLPRNEGWVCNQDGLPCWYNLKTEQWLSAEGKQIKVTAWCDMPHLEKA